MNTALKLLPHQIALSDTFFDSASKPILLLRGDVGLGKSAALAALVGRVLQKQTTARVLLMVPAPLQSQFAERLNESATPVLVVDRYQFRKMLDSTPGNDIWPRGIVTVLSREFARQTDVLETLASTRWDLLVVDEANARSAALQRLAPLAERIVLAAFSNASIPEPFSSEEVTIVDWRADRLLDEDGRPLRRAPRPVLNEVSFSPDPIETDIQNTLESISHALNLSSTSETWVTRSLVRSLQSSPAALEAALRRLIAKLEQQYEIEGVFQTPHEDEEEEFGDQIGPNTPEKENVSELVEKGIQQIESIEADSKFDTLARLLRALTEPRTPPRQVCVLTNYLATLYYLAEGIEGLGLKCHLLHGGMSNDDRHHSVAAYLSGAGVLLATNAVMVEGLSLADVTDLIFYDVPTNKIAIQQVLGRFDRITRLKQLDVHVLVSSRTDAQLTSESVEMLREVFKSFNSSDPTKGS